MAFDKIIKWPQANSPLLAASEVTVNLPRNYRHHTHVLVFAAMSVAVGVFGQPGYVAPAPVTDAADIVDTIEYQINGIQTRAPLTPAQLRWLQNTHSPENYSGYNTNAVVVNWREWQMENVAHQDEFSVAMGGVVQFVAVIKFKAGLTDIKMDDSFILADDGMTVDAKGVPVVIPAGGLRRYEKVSVQNSAAGDFTINNIRMSEGNIKRITFEDAGKLDAVDVLVDKEVVWTLTRAKMVTLLRDVMGLDTADTDTANRFTLPFDFLNRGESGLGMRRADGSLIDFEIRAKTNAAGGFAGIVERFARPDGLAV